MPNNTINMDKVYLEALIAEAMEQAIKLKEKNLFDPQGSVIVNVSNRDVEAVLRNKFPNEGEQVSSYLKKKKENTVVSLDITNDEALNALFLSKISSRPSVQEKLDECNKGSINPVYRELYFHLNATQQIAQRLKLERPDEIQSEFQETLQEVNQHILQRYQDAVQQSHALGNNDYIATINQRLDKARASALKIAHETFIQKLQAKGIEFSKSDLKQIQDLSEETTATPDDILYVGPTQVTWGSGNSYSSHHRLETKENATKINFGSQITQTHAYDPDSQTITINQNERLQIRASSLALKRGFDLLYYFKGKSAVDKPFIDDVEHKLSVQTTQHELDKHLKQIKNQPLFKPKAIVYNLYTALNDNSVVGLIDEFNNKQSQSAEYILKGAHQYNQKQFNTNGSIQDNGVLCLVQNISVNGFGYPLGYNSGNPLVEEATLMTDMALLHTLWDKNIDDSSITLAFGEYYSFLQKSNREAYFSQSAEGKRALKHIEQFKQSKFNNKGNNFPNGSQSLTTDAKRCLFKLMSTNQHHRNDATCFQALSVFLEACSMGGCKSAIDRTPMVNNRVAMLDRALNDKDPIADEVQAIKTALTDLSRAQGEDAIKKYANELEIALDNAVNRLGLHTGSALQTNAEIGGAPKYNAKKESFFARIFGQNTNNAEKSTMTNVSQKEATQSHKTLASAFKSAWKMIMQLTQQKPISADKMQSVQKMEPTSGLTETVSNEQSNLKHRIPTDSTAESTNPTINRNDGQSEQSSDLNNNSTSEKILREIEIRDTGKKLLGQIGNYSTYKKSDDKTQLTDHKFVDELLSQESQKKLYQHPESYQSSGTQHRENFIKFMTERRLMTGGLPIQINDDSPITMENFFGKEGIRLYQLALEEEVNSEEYRSALFRASTMHFDGDKFENKLVVHVAGPSASGKTSATKQVINAISTPESSISKNVVKNSNDKNGNDFVSVDGGIVREVSQIRKLAIRIANKQGYSGLRDLDKQSTKILEPIKKNIYEAVMSEEKLNCIIPDTYSDWSKPNWFGENKADRMKAIDNMSNTQQIFCRVDGKDPNTFKTVVKAMGEKRAWNTNPITPENTIDLNNTDDLSESKAYHSSGFEMGRFFSKRAHNFFNANTKERNVSLVLRNDLVIREETDEKSITTTFLVSQRIIDEWDKKSAAEKEVLPLNQYKDTDEAKELIKDPIIDEQYTVPSLKESLQNRRNSTITESLGNQSNDRAYSPTSVAEPAEPIGADLVNNIQTQNIQTQMFIKNQIKNKPVESTKVANNESESEKSTEIPYTNLSCL